MGLVERRAYKRRADETGIGPAPASAPAPALLLFLLSTFVVFAGCFHASQEPGPLEDQNGEPIGDRLRLVEVTSDLDRPTFAIHPGGPTSGLYVLEQAGRVRYVDSAGLESKVVLDIADRVGTDHFEQGLLGMAFPPGSLEGAAVVLSYTDRSGDSVVSWFQGERLEEGRLQWDAGSEQVILRQEQPFGNHNGGMVAFAPDGMLLVGFGDGGSAGDPHGNGQDPSTWLGSILRVEVSPGEAGYTVPADNPFVGAERGADEVWTFGLRNPWRFSFDRDTGDLWIADVGQNRFEEVNLVPAGEGAGWNFGWPRFEGLERFSDVEVEGEAVAPVGVYPIRGTDHCSVTGGYVYRGDEVPALRGVYVLGDWCSGVLWGVQEVDGEWVLGELMKSPRRPSSFAEDGAGELYLVDHEGGLYRFEKTPG